MLVNDVNWWNIGECSNYVLRKTPWIARSGKAMQKICHWLFKSKSLYERPHIPSTLSISWKIIEAASKYMRLVAEIMVVQGSCSQGIMLFRARWDLAMPFSLQFLLFPQLSVVREKGGPSCGTVIEYNLRISLITHYFH